jgi:5-methylcytosine-specific restriction endonuclease McrA
MRCKNRDHSRNMTGVLNSNYSGRSKPRNGGLWENMAPLIRERDGLRCTTCGEAPALSSSLHVHHIDHDPTNNVPENLITLCAADHMTHHKSLEPPFCLSTPRLKADAARRSTSMTSTLKETITSLLTAFSSTTA